MRAYELGEQGSVDTLKIVERPEPTPGPGEASVRFHAQALNYRDHMIINLIDSAQKPSQRIPLSDGAGEVVKVGDGVSTLTPGDRVMPCFFTRWVNGPLDMSHFGSDLGGGTDGTLTEIGCFPAASLVQIPDSISYEEAACLPCAALTAWTLLIEFGQMRAGDTVLLLGTGGVSIFGLQFAHMMGAEAVITSSSDEKLEIAKSLGATHGINYRTDPTWGEIVQNLTGGANIIVECGGAATLEQSITAAAINARIGLIGMLGGVGGKIDPLGLLWKTLNLRGIFVGSAASLATMTRAVALNGLKPVIDTQYRFDAAVDAYRHLASGEHLGKIVISSDA